MAAILLVDDDPAMLEMMLALLDESKHQVVPTQSLTEAKEMMEYAYFDFVFLDGMDTDRSSTLSSFLKTLPSHFTGEVVCTSDDDSICHELHELGVRYRVFKFEVSDWLNRQDSIIKKSA